jgi:hypothetical protein
MNKEFIIVIYKLEAKISRRGRKQKDQKRPQRKTFNQKENFSSFFSFSLKSKQLTNTLTKSKKRNQRKKEKSKYHKEKFLTKRKLLKPFSQIP